MTAYIIKSSLSLVLLYGLYWLLLRKEKFFVFNRFFLIFAILFSMLMPFVSIPIVIRDNQVKDNIISAVYGNMESISSKQIPATDISIQIPAGTATFIHEPSSGISLIQFLIILYSCCVLLLLIRFVRNIFFLTRLKKLSESISYAGHRIALINEQFNPFCFFNTIFINRNDYLNGKIAKELITHEIEHIKQSHSVDVIFVELIRIIYWFNPILILYNRAVRANHEYLADNAVIKNSPDIKGYADKLINFIGFKRNIQLTSGFNQSLTKKRLIMMTNSRSGILATCIRITLTFLFILAFLVLISFKQAKTQTVKMAFVPYIRVDTTRLMKSDTSYNVIRYSEGFYISNEITNKEYREFTDWVKNNPEESLFQTKDYTREVKDPKSGKMREVTFHIPDRINAADLLPDLTDSTALYKLDNRYKNYFTDKKYDDYPVVGVSQKMAEYFCLWKNKSEVLIKKADPDGENSIAVSPGYTYRLPTETEWEYAAKTQPDINSRTSHSELIQPVNEGDANKPGLSHFESNVSEWVSSSQANYSVAKGSSWESNSAIADRNVYDPGYEAGTIGFRIVRAPDPKLKGGENIFRRQPVKTETNRMSSSTAYEKPELFPIRIGDYTKIPRKFQATRIKSGQNKDTVLFHYGYDIEAKYGTEVIASAAGKVIKASWDDKGYGRLIIIDHGEGYQSLYAHLKDFNVKEGDAVLKGQTIGYVGSSGLSTGPHLHFEIKINGKSVNPLTYIK